jgi:nitric oxide synthase-interacting protein
VDEEELMRLGNGEQAKVKRRASGQTGGNDELPSFWVPSKTPDNKKADIKAIKQHPTCPAASPDKPHDFTLKTLITVNFSEDKPTNGSEIGVRTCPSCNKALSNSTKAILARPCGHVLCKPCSDKFQKSPEKSAHDETHDETIRCYVCQEDITPGRKVKRKKDEGKDGKDKETKIERGLVELSTEGTGFAGGGKNMVKREGVAFQC